MSENEKPADENLISIYRASSSQQATLLKTLLTNFEIDCEVDGGALQDGAGELPVGWAAAPRIRVWKKDEEDARQIIEDFENGKFAHDDEQGWINVDFADGGFNWPECPQCEESRHAICSACQFVGLDFETEALFNVSIGDNGSVADHSSNPFLLVCPICAEKNSPQFLDHCKFCSHTFQDGSKVETDTLLPEQTGINLPVLLVGLCLFLIILAGIIYFAFI